MTERRYGFAWVITRRADGAVLAYAPDEAAALRTARALGGPELVEVRRYE